MKKIYAKVDFKKGYPVGRDLFYECEICGDVLPALPSDEFARCKCKNITIDISSARIGAKDESKVRVFELKK